jgi:hypothetical protein
MIAAHEIGHFVLGSAGHAKTGLMQAYYTHAHRLLSSGQPLALDRGSRARLPRPTAGGRAVSLTALRIVFRTINNSAGLKSALRA